MPGAGTCNMASRIANADGYAVGCPGFRMRNHEGGVPIPAWALGVVLDVGTSLDGSADTTGLLRCWACADATSPGWSLSAGEPSNPCGVMATAISPPPSENATLLLPRGGSRPVDASSDCCHGPDALDHVSRPVHRSSDRTAPQKYSWYCSTGKSLWSSPNGSSSSFATSHIAVKPPVTATRHTRRHASRHARSVGDGTHASRGGAMGSTRRSSPLHPPCVTLSPAQAVTSSSLASPSPPTPRPPLPPSPFLSA